MWLEVFISLLYSFLHTFSSRVNEKTVLGVIFQEGIAAGFFGFCLCISTKKFPPVFLVLLASQS
jgi:hypothetical protein